MSSDTHPQQVSGTPRQRPGGVHALRGWLSRFKTYGIWVGAVVLILLAVLVSGLRLALPMASDYRAQVAGELSELLGHRVEIGALDARWRLLGPRILLDDVAIYNDVSADPLLRLSQVDVGVRALLSLWHRQLRVHSVRVLGADVHLLRDAEGGFHVSGTGLAASDSDEHSVAPNAQLLDLLAGTRFQLQSSRLHFTDEILVLDYQFDDINLHLDVGRDRLRLAGEVFMPRELGRGLAVGVDVRGNPGQRESWRGQFYLRGEGLLIDQLPEKTLSRQLNAQSGVLGAEVWGRLARGDLERVRARLSVERLRFAPLASELPRDASGETAEAQGAASATLSAVQGAEQQADLDVQADVLWERKPGGWELRVHDARIQEGAPQGLSMIYREDALERQIWGELDGVRLERLATVALAQGRLLKPEHRQWLQLLAPVGEIAQASFHLRLGDEGEPPRARVQGEFRELGMSPHEKIPGFHGLDGAFSLDERGGALSLASRGLRFEAPRLFAEPLWLDALGGRVHVERTDEGYRVSGEDVRLHNADVRAWGRVQLDLGSRPSMDLALDFSDGDGSRTATYLPVGIMRPNLYRWLSESIVDGRVREGRVVFRGPLVKLPFKEGEGVFQVEAQVEEGVLDYRPGWPAISDLQGTLIFDDRGMRAQSASGRIFDARISEATVGIEDFKAAVLDIDGRVDGSLADMLRYVRQSPLVSGLDGLLDETRAEGDSRLDLSLHIPLGRRTGGPRATRAEGVVTLDENRLSLTGQPVDFQSIKGQVRFTEATVEASEVSARFNEEALTLAASLPRGGALTISAQGMQPVSAFASVLPDYLRGRLSGRAPWEARLRAPLGGGGATMLRLQSRLEGVALRLPEPFGKPAARAVPLTVEVPLTARDVTPLQLSYGQILSALLRPAIPGRPARGELRLNDGQARMPERGVRVAGRLEELILDDWMTLQASARSSDIHAPAEQLVDAVDLRIARLRSGARLIPQVQIQASRSAQRWEAYVQSPVLNGRLDIPHDLDGAAPLTLNLDLLDLDALADSAQGEAASGDDGRAGPRLDPRELPGIRATVVSLVLDGRSFRDLRLEATRIREGLQIHHLQVDSARGHAQIRMNGDWRVSAAGRHQTQLRFDINSGDVGAALTDLGFEHGFDRGNARLDGQLRWPDAATHFTWEGLQGNARVDLKDGRLMEVEPGAGRLLGLFSLNMIPRRLALDFRDLFQRGLSFDTLTGNIRLVDGDAYTSDLAIASSAAHIHIEGRTGIVARDYDQKVVVTPRVGSALPVAGVILGGPVGGVAVFVMDKILGMGKRIDEASRVEYLITGPWAQARVEVVAQPVEETP